MTEKGVTPVPCLRSHDLSRYQTSPSSNTPGGGGRGGQEDEEILRLLQQMPSILRPCDEGDPRDPINSTFHLAIPHDVDPNSANQLDPSWFVNIVVTVTDRNGCVIYHEAHFPKNPFLRDGISNFVDVRWSDFVHPPDVEIWNQHLSEAVAEADRWRAARLAASQSPPPPPSAPFLSSTSAINTNQRRRRISSGGGSSFGGGISQQQVVSTTSRMSPDMAEAAANAEALLRRFILSPLYRAHWRSASEVFYFRTISLPFLRNQGINGNEAARDKLHSSTPTVVNESTSVFSPTSSFENLLLLNYHCILGKVPGDSLLESISSCESTVFDAVALRVAQKRTYLSPLKSATNTISSNQPSSNINSSSPNSSSIEHLATVFCFDNIFSEDGCDCNNEDSKFSEFGQDCHYRFFEESEQNQRTTTPARTPSYSSAHLAPVDIDWIDQTLPLENANQSTASQPTPQSQFAQQRPRNSSGISQVTSTVTRGISSGVSSQKDGSFDRHRLKSAVMTHSPLSNLPPELNKFSSQDDKISIFLSLLLPEAIREIKEAISAEPDMVAQRVRAIVVRHLGPEILSRFFSNSSSSSHNHRQNINKNQSQQQQQTPSSTENSNSNPSNGGSQNLPPPQTSSIALTTSSTCPGRMSSASSETSLCGSSCMETASSIGSLKATTAGQLLRESDGTPTAATRPASALAASSSSFTAHPQPPKRPSLVQELSVPPSEPDSLPLPPPPPPALFSSPSSSSNMDFQTFFGIQQQSQPSTSPGAQDAHSSAGVLEALLMGNYDPSKSRLRRGSSSATSIRQRNVSEATAVSSKSGPESRQLMSNSGPSSASCPPTKSGDSNFAFESEEWNNGEGNSSSNEAKNTSGNTSAQSILSPNPSNPCSSLAHLLRHGYPPSSSFSTSSTAAPASLPIQTPPTGPPESALTSPGLPTACAARANRLAASAGVPKPLDTPLTVIVPSDSKCRGSDGVQGSSYEKISHSTPKGDGPSPPKQSRIEFSDGMSLASLPRKPEARRSTEEEDMTLANSSLCRLLQGADPWDSLTAEVDAAAQAAQVAPPPPPPSFFELSSDALIAGDNERRARYDSYPPNSRKPLSVPAQQRHMGLAETPSSSKLHPSQTSVPEMFNGPQSSSSSAPPSAVNAIDLNRSMSPATLEKNRRAAAAAAAQIAEEAENQRRQRPSSQHYYERQNVSQVTTYGQDGHSLLEGTPCQQQPCSLNPPPPQHHQSQPNSNYGSLGNNNAMVYSEYDAPQMMSNQRPPLEDFSRQLKEVAPNVRVAPTGYHQNMYLPEQQMMAPMPQNYDYSGGHLAPVNYDYQDRSMVLNHPLSGPNLPPSPQQSHHYCPPPSQPMYCSSSGYCTATSATHLPPIQPKIPQPYRNQQPQQQSAYYQQPQATRHLQQPQQQMACQQSPQRIHAQMQIPPSRPQPMNQSTANYSAGYYDRHQCAAYQHQSQNQHQMMSQSQSSHSSTPLSPLSMALQQNQSLPANSQVKANLREKVTSRCLAQGMEVPLSSGVGRSQILPTSGQRRSRPSELLNNSGMVVGGRGGGEGNGYYYAQPPPPPQYQQTIQCSPNIPSNNEIGSPLENLMPYTNSDQQLVMTQQQEPQPQSLEEFRKQQIPYQQSPSKKYIPLDEMATPNGDIRDKSIAESNADRVNEDIQLTDDLVNDVLEQRTRVIQTVLLNGLYSQSLSLQSCKCFITRLALHRFAPFSAVSLCTYADIFSSRSESPAPIYGFLLDFCVSGAPSPRVMFCLSQEPPTGMIILGLLFLAFYFCTHRLPNVSSLVK
ncbi:unnamed protein product [Rodentolepis nana]|uniref:Uncharacterized protein n=1 Tax=Rodentolepis nana TaxID=102285 RepID=A0A158QGI2_RODNA|nr:unnamed protein product [Rodentolepis nana]